MINTNRLCDIFEELVRIDSPSCMEAAVCQRLQKIFTGLGAEIFIDESMDKTGSEAGNLIAFFPGQIHVPSIMLSGHMDTVEPGKGIQPVLSDGIYRSAGDTILGADDKSALAIIIEVLNVIKENSLSVCPIEVVLTTCEEKGLLGAKALDVSKIKSRFGYILDSTDAEGIVTQAPAATRFTFRVYGKAAHAGAQPEKGLSAISIAASAVAALQTGRIDDETTCNIGTFKAGTATNIIPDLAIIEGEARSHSVSKLEAVTASIIKTFEDAVESAKKNSPDPAFPFLEKEVVHDFLNIKISNEHQVVKLACKAAGNLGKNMKTVTVGGGSDANVFFHKGIAAVVIGTGMKDLHTTGENISVDDMVATAGLVLEIIRVYSAEKI